MALNQAPAPATPKDLFLKLADAEGLGEALVTLPVYVLSARNLARGEVAAHAKRTGWQFLTVSRGGLSITGDASDPETVQRTAVSRVRGPGVESLRKIFDAVRSFEEVQQFPFEPRALRIPDLHIEAFWLRRQPERPAVEQLDRDFVVPYKTFDKRLKEQRILTMRQFIDATREMARKQSRADHPKD